MYDDKVVVLHLVFDVHADIGGLVVDDLLANRFGSSRLGDTTADGIGEDGYASSSSARTANIDRLGDGGGDTTWAERNALGRESARLGTAALDANLLLNNFLLLAQSLAGYHIVLRGR